MDPLKMGTKMWICAIILFGFCFAFFILSMNYWQNKFDIVKEEMTEIKDQNAGLKVENAKLKEEMADQIAGQNQEFEEKIRALEGKFKESFINLTKQNDGNEFVNEFNFNSYKWNANGNFGSELNISENGLNVKYSGLYNGLNGVVVFANLPIPKFNLSAKNPTISFYYEVKILSRGYGYIAIGFCDKKQPLEDKQLGYLNNSIGIHSKNGMIINGIYIQLENSAGGDFQNWDVVGLGIVYTPAISQIACFATLNGKLLGNVELSSKFATFPMFPAVNLFSSGQIIRTNFGNEKFRFNTSQLLQELVEW